MLPQRAHPKHLLANYGGVFQINGNLLMRKIRSPSPHPTMTYPVCTVTYLRDFVILGEAQ